MSEGAARVAADGRGGPPVRPVSEVAVRSSAGPQPGDALRLVGKIEELAAGLCRRGVSEEKALREAAFAVFRVAPDESTQDWVAQVTGRRWPGLGDARVRQVAARAALPTGQAGRSASDSTGVGVNVTTHGSLVDQADAGGSKATEGVFLAPCEVACAATMSFSGASGAAGW